MVPIIMPQVGHHIQVGSIVKWHIKEQDPVNKGDIILSVESEKATFDVEAEDSGVVIKILFHEGEEAEVLKPVGYIGEKGEIYQETEGEPDGRAVETHPQETASANKTRGKGQGYSTPVQVPEVRTAGDGAPDAAGGAERVKASPVAKKLAKHMGILLRTIRGTGPGNRIVKEDVLAAIRTEQPVRLQSERTAPPPSEGDQVVHNSKLRQVMADRLSRSKQNIPHFYLFLDVDMEDTLAWRRSYNQNHNAHITVTDLVLYATARALRENPRLNAHVQQDRITLKSRINIGVATAVQDGILVPFIHDADQKDVVEISREVKGKTEEARRGILDPDMERSFTVTSLGMFGIQRCLPIINPPECGILGVGAAEPRVIPQGNLIGIRTMMTLSLACDHRAVDGVYGSKFLKAVRSHLMSPFIV